MPKLLTTALQLQLSTRLASCSIPRLVTAPASRLQIQHRLKKIYPNTFPVFVRSFTAFEPHRSPNLSSPAHKRQKMAKNEVDEGIQDIRDSQHTEQVKNNQHPQNEGEGKDPHTGQSTSTEGMHEWKKRAPYKIHDDGSDFKVRYEASCHCGKVKYQLSREEPLDSKLCHCTTCQTQHAAPFQWAAIFHKDDINFVHGHHNLEWYDPSEKSIEHKLPCKVRCAYCHSPIMDEGRNMILLFPSLVHFKNDEDKHNFKPRCHMFYGQRVIDIPDGLPKWSGLNNESDLIEDSPPEKVKERERQKEKEREEKFKKGENK